MNKYNILRTLYISTLKFNIPIKSIAYRDKKTYNDIRHDSTPYSFLTQSRKIRNFLTRHIDYDNNGTVTTTKRM